MSSSFSSVKSRIALLLLLCFAALFQGCASREERIQKIQSKANEALFENEPARAIDILRDGLDTFADSNELRIDLSKALQNQGSNEEAVALLEAAVEQNPEQDQLWVQIGELHAQMGNSDKAILAFEAYLKNNGSDFLAWKALTQEYEKKGLTTQAIKAASRWNEITPSSQPALKLGELYLLSRNIPQARSWFGQAAAYEDNYASKEALAELIKLETSLKQLQQASNWLRTYQQRYPNDLNDPRIRESRNVIENWIRAREEITRAARELEQERRELEERNRSDQRQQAEEQQDVAKTLQDFEETEEPETAPSQQQPSAATASTSEKAPEALFGDDQPTAAPESQSQDRPDLPAEVQLSPYEEAIAALEAQDYSNAIALFSDLLVDDPDNAEIWYQLSRAYYGRGDWYDAEATILEAKRRAPRSETIAYQYLMTARKTQNTTRVLEEIKATRLLFPRSPAIALILAQTLRDANAAKSVVSAAYRDFLSIANRNDPGYREANQYLQSGN
ncbi:tetratricopeptide repeat protein [Pelagicoccus sp. SDUM812003]|uniref:tetratricopeptide repeat protein n=1 Tax=Pelagicoccus sp. SDUM812003 TaxID=3041267 RepID=UPI00280FCDF4|nr:tetratricopeptide repeat protein [Pelagicoccus sp. SDUM812003]MDQ8203293.1 tetratricopeptide repeat protein [Pelagicoccus sp. SDUM812003]